MKTPRTAQTGQQASTNSSSTISRDTAIFFRKSTTNHGDEAPHQIGEAEEG
jgi:hypothetical protein